MVTIASCLLHNDSLFSSLLSVLQYCHVELESHYWLGYKLILKSLVINLPLFCWAEHMHILRRKNFIPVLWRNSCTSTPGKMCKEIHNIIVCNGIKTGNNPNSFNRRINKYIIDSYTIENYPSLKIDELLLCETIQIKRWKYEDDVE